MTSVGPVYCGTAANVNDGGTYPWVNPSNAEGDTTSTLTSVSFVSTSLRISQALRCTNFGFAIPEGATIDGLYVQIENQGNGVVTNWNAVKLLLAGAEAGTNMSDGSILSGSKNMKTFGSGGFTDLWGLTPTPADINDVGFGVSIKTSRSGGSGTILTSIYRVRIAVGYTYIAGPSYTDAPSGRMRIGG